MTSTLYTWLHLILTISSYSFHFTNEKVEAQRGWVFAQNHTAGKQQIWDMNAVWSLLLLLISHFSHVRFCAIPWTAAHQAPPSPGFSRQEHWSGLPFPSPMHESGKWKWSRSVVSDSWRPHGLQPTRLLRPWGFPGKSTGVGCHCLLPGWSLESACSVP